MEALDEEIGGKGVTHGHAATSVVDQVAHLVQTCLVEVATEDIYHVAVLCCPIGQTLVVLQMDRYNLAWRLS